VSAVAPDDVRAFILEHVAESLAAKGVGSEAIPNDFDLLLEGVIDSFGLIELIGALESRFGVALNFEELDPDTVTLVGSLADYVSNQAATSS
jgi:acyl carrier protein